MQQISLWVLTAAMGPVMADSSFVVEDEKGLIEIPVEVRRTVLGAIGPSATHCAPKSKKDELCALSGFAIDLDGKGDTAEFLVIPQDARLWAASAAPVWIVAVEGGKPRILLEHVTYTVTLLDTSAHGMRDIKTERATAALVEWELWKYDGNKYVAAERHADRPE